MSDERALAIVQSMIHERQRLRIREANYLRGLVRLPPVRAEPRQADEGVTKPRSRGGQSGHGPTVE